MRLAHYNWRFFKGCVTGDLPNNGLHFVDIARWALWGGVEAIHIDVKTGRPTTSDSPAWKFWTRTYEPGFEVKA